MWQPQQNLERCAGCSALICSDLWFQNGTPVVTFWREGLSWVHSQVVKSLLTNTSNWASDMFFTLLVTSCYVHASQAKGWMCSSWLTFTTLGTRAPTSNPSIDQDCNEDHESYFTFLVSRLQMAPRRRDIMFAQPGTYSAREQKNPFWLFPLLELFLFSVNS